MKNFSCLCKIRLGCHKFTNYNSEMANESHETEFLAQIGQTVRTLRKARGLSRRQVVEAAGISERYLIQVEAAEANATALILDRIARALGVTLKDLVEGEKTPGPTGGLDPDLAALLRSMTDAEQKDAAPILRKWIEERRRSRRGVALLGLRGAGKSTIGKLFAQRHKLPFVSVTQEIENRTGIQLNDLFNLGGAEAYRAMETETIVSLCASGEFTVLETAGGIVANSDALDAVLSSYRTVWLKASPQAHLERVISQGDMRPIKAASSALEHVRNLLEQRSEQYARAEFTLDTTDRSPLDCVRDLERLLGYPEQS